MGSGSGRFAIATRSIKLAGKLVFVVLPHGPHRFGPNGAKAAPMPFTGPPAGRAKRCAGSSLDARPCGRLRGLIWPTNPLDLRTLVNENDQADRAISTGKLHALLHFHTRPIDVVVFHGSDREYWF